jgi:hypothetical protein
MSRPGRLWIIASVVANASDCSAVLEDIRTLTATRAPLLDQVERALVDGYACALGIEAERLRLQRRLEDRAVALGESSGPGVEEVAGLAQGVARADEELAELRAALAGLAAVAEKLRA